MRNHTALREKSHVFEVLHNIREIWPGPASRGGWEGPRSGDKPPGLNVATHFSMFQLRGAPQIRWLCLGGGIPPEGNRFVLGAGSVWRFQKLPGPSHARRCTHARRFVAIEMAPRPHLKQTALTVLRDPSRKLGPYPARLAQECKGRGQGHSSRPATTAQDCAECTQAGAQPPRNA